MAPLLINFHFPTSCRFRLKRFLLCVLHNDYRHFAYQKMAINLFVSLCTFTFFVGNNWALLGGAEEGREGDMSSSGLELV